LLLTLTLVVCSAKVYRTGDVVPQMWTEVQDIIDNFDDINSLHFVSGLFGAGQGEFEFEYIKGSGFVTGTTIHPTASAAKEFSISAAMVAVERGYLSLHDYPSKYLSYWTTDQSDRRSRVTLAQLMSYTSSMRSTSCTDMTLAQCVRAYYEANANMTNEPGTTFWYSTTDFQVVAQMVVEATGFPDWISWFDYALRVPLNIPNTTRYTSTTNPSLAGGMETTHYGYLQWFVPYFSHNLHLESTYVDIETDMTPVGRVDIVSPAYSTSTHYSLGHHLECTTEIWDNACYEQNWRSTIGAFGLNPFKDRKNNYFGSIMTVEGSTESVTLAWMLHPAIADAYGFPRDDVPMPKPEKFLIHDEEY